MGTSTRGEEEHPHGYVGYEHPPRLVGRVHAHGAHPAGRACLGQDAPRHRKGAKWGVQGGTGAYGRQGRAPGAHWACQAQGWEKRTYYYKHIDDLTPEDRWPRIWAERDQIRWVRDA